MKVQILFFGITTDLLGFSNLEIDSTTSSRELASGLKNIVFPDEIISFLVYRFALAH